jgi:hypothetical protein
LAEARLANQTLIALRHYARYRCNPVCQWLLANASLRE